MPINAGSSPADPGATVDAAADLEVHIAQTGDRLLAGLSSVVDSLRAPTGPQALATELGIDKVLASRVLKAIQSPDPMSVVHRAPGPEPLRRVLKASAKRGVPPELIANAEAAVDRFEALIRDRIGDRSALEAIVSAWAPDARREFELRRKQTAFRAMSQLKGVQASVNLASVFLHPSPGDERLDVVWITGLLGLQRIRPGAAVKFATRRMNGSADGDRDRRPLDLGGTPVSDYRGLQLERFCSTPTPPLEVHHVGEVVHYTLGDTGFGPRSEVDIVFGEANIAELDRYIEPGEAGKKAYVFAEVLTPSRTLQLDLFVHRDLYPDQHPSLLIYDTASEGVANINDRSRDIDRLDLMESIESLGQGIARCRSSDVPRYGDLLGEVCERLGWDGGSFRAFRCRIDYPLYGSQVAMALNAIVRP